MNYAEAIVKRKMAAERNAKRAEKAIGLWQKRVKVKKPKLLGRKQLVKRLDAAFSILVRIKTKQEIGHCAFCPNPIQDCFHFLTRSKYSIRWDFRNAIGSCKGCNFKNEFDPHSFIAYFLKRWGQEAYEKLVLDGNTLSDYSIHDLRQLLDSMTGTLKPLEAR